MYAIETKDLTKKYNDVTAVDHLNLKIKYGELYALLGVNGAGKTTAIKMLTTITSPTNGNAYVGGFNISSESIKVKEIIAVSPQETAIAPNLSVKENLELICGVHGFTKEFTVSKIEIITKQLSLQTVLKKKAGKLSGGWQRRLSIAMALICDPEILFLDEPTLGLDVIARYELWDLIRSLKGKITIILTTHYLQEAEVLSDRVGIMKNGLLLAEGTVQQLNKSVNETNFESAFVRIVKDGEL